MNVGGNQHLLRHSSLRQLRFTIFAIIAVYFSSFALRLLAGALTLQVLALQGLNPTASKPAEPSVGCCPAKHRARGARDRGRKGACKRASEETGTRALETRERELPGRGNPQEPEKKNERERKKEKKKPAPELLSPAQASESEGRLSCSSWKSLCGLASALSGRPPGRRQRRGEAGSVNG